jgi:archaellum component FlaF (FlaF/FlaG flagellin family)
MTEPTESTESTGSLKAVFALIAFIIVFSIVISAYVKSNKNGEKQYLSELEKQHQNFLVMGTVVDTKPIFWQEKSTRGVEIKGTVLVLDNDTAIGIDAHIDFVSPGSALKLAPKDDHDARAYCVVGKTVTCAREVAINFI